MSESEFTLIGRKTLFGIPLGFEKELKNGENVGTSAVSGEVVVKWRVTKDGNLECASVNGSGTTVRSKSLENLLKGGSLRIPVGWNSLKLRIKG